MWYYTIHGNGSQLLMSSKHESLYRTEQEAIAAGGKVAARLTRVVGISLTVAAGRMGD
jgi:hypothetical protein